MTAGDRDGGVFALAEIHRLLLLANGGCGLHRQGEYHRHAAGNAPQNAAIVVGGGGDLAVFYLVIVIKLTAV